MRTHSIKWKYTGAASNKLNNFPGIIPSREARCVGKITLDVVFGSPENHRSEEITFQVVPFSSGYHALLGRDAFTCFQDIPHYGYMELKMPGPNGVITLASDPDIALRAKNKTASLALEALSEALGRRINCTMLHSGQGRRDPRQTPQIHLIQTSRRNSQIPGPPNRPQEDSIYQSSTEPNS